MIIIAFMQEQLKCLKYNRNIIEMISIKITSTFDVFIPACLKQVAFGLFLMQSLSILVIIYRFNIIIKVRILKIIGRMKSIN